VSTHPDEQYLTWLYDQIGVSSLKNPARTHWALAKQLYTKEFLWFVPNDDNRVEDGKDLRYEFLETCDVEVNPDSDWLDLGCSMLEMLIALSRRLSFEGDGEPREWFWEMLENIGIFMAHTNDQHYNRKIRHEIDEALNRIIFRTYSPNGDGGLFPLVDTNEDQRKVEIWYQMSEYLITDI